MNLDEIRIDLEDRFPMWGDRIRLLRFQAASGVRPVDNNGSVIFYDHELMNRFNRDKQTFYMAQQLLHIQFAHKARGAGKDRFLWKQATDAVVNAMLKSEGFPVPEEIMIVRNAANMSAEELYDVYYESGEWEGPSEDASDPIIIDTEQHEKVKESGDKTKAKEITIDDPGLAAAVAGLAELLEPSLQVDYDWFPGTTIRDGMLRYDFRAYPVARAEILLDTSASVDAALLRYFVRAVKALMREDAQVRVGCFDTRFYGFKDIYTEEDIEKLELRGAGGTDFNVAVAAFTGDAENQIIFTDGYAEMPEDNCNAIWVVYGSMPIHPKGGRVIYAKASEEKEVHEIDFLIT